MILQYWEQKRHLEAVQISMKNTSAIKNKNNPTQEKLFKPLAAEERHGETKTLVSNSTEDSPEPSSVDNKTIEHQTEVSDTTATTMTPTEEDSTVLPVYDIDPRR